MATSKQIERQLSLLQTLIAGSSAGLLIEEIDAKQNLDLDRRTLQRRLRDLIKNGEIASSGKGRATRYAVIAAAAVKPLPTQPDMFVPVSKAGSEILRLVRRPLTARKPVGYDRQFLDRYRPNRTSYFTNAEKLRLREFSRTTETAWLPAGTHARQILNRLLIDLSWNSSRLEGNTYSLLDTQRLIEAGEAAEGKAPAETQMILNHKDAIEFVVGSAGEIGLNRHTILSLHSLLAQNLLPNPAAGGRIRRTSVGIAKSVDHPLETQQVLEECFDRILETAAAIDDPFEQALFAMVQLPYLQPFEDVNKRVSRLAANIPLVKRNLSPLSFVDVPVETYVLGVLGVHELNRVDLLKDVFLWAYERSAARYGAIRQSIGEPDLFRLRHRQALRQVVAAVIRAPMNQKIAARHIATWAVENVVEIDRSRFVETAETELIGLHDGNYARYQVRPSEYAAWREGWDFKPVTARPALAAKRKSRSP